jgi:hypothetical protein
MCACLLFFGGCSEKSSFHPERRKCLKELVRYLRVYSAYDENGPLVLRRMGRDYDGGYVVAEKSLQKADALLGYGIADDISFEEAFCDLYKKPAYGFDGGIEGIKSHNKLFTFMKECISSNKFLYGGEQPSVKISTFPQQLDRLKLKNKKVFIKMDIEGAEFEAFPDILPYHQNITGIAFEMHFKSLENLKKAIALLSDLEKEFILIHVHGNNACGSGFSTKDVRGKVRYMLELTYINKNLVTTFELSKNQKHPTSLDMPNISSRPDAEFEVQV